MDPELEARIVEMRRAHPGWVPRTILFWLEHDGVSPLPGRTSVERCLVRHGLVPPQARKRERSDNRHQASTAEGQQRAQDRTVTLQTRAPAHPP
jgi:hypothetical protein